MAFLFTLAGLIVAGAFTGWTVAVDKLVATDIGPASDIAWATEIGLVSEEGAGDETFEATAVRSGCRAAKVVNRSPRPPNTPIIRSKALATTLLCPSAQSLVMRVPSARWYRRFGRTPSRNQINDLSSSTVIPSGL